MNRFLLATVSSLAVAIATQAGAADLPMKARAPAMVDAPWSWTGFYIGAHVGAGWGTKEWNDPTESSLFSDAQGTVNGVLGGVQAGFNYQFAPHWLVGIEGDFSGADVKGTYPCFVSNGPDTCTSKSTWFATLTGRVGATVDHALVYVKGGAAWTHDDYTDSFISDGTEIWRASHTRLGYVLGTGIEYAIDRN
jgi:outer membrane immunogenic protein